MRRAGRLLEAGILSFIDSLIPDSAGENALGPRGTSLKAWRAGRGPPPHSKQLSEAPSCLRANGRDESHCGWDVRTGFGDLSEAFFVWLNT